MGLIGASIVKGNRRKERAGDHGEAASAEPRPFSHDSHFSVSPLTAHGYHLQVIEEIIVIAANGQIVAVEHPQFPAGGRRDGAMRVPVAPMPRRQDALRFLWGYGQSVLGPVGAGSRLFEEARATEGHEEFKALHHRVLDGVGDIALQAFLRFLERETAPGVSELPMIVGRPRCKLAFRFQYDEHYLHERHAAQLAWRRFLTEQPAGAARTGPSAAHPG